METYIILFQKRRRRKLSRILIGNVRDKLINNLLATKAGTGALDAAQGKVLKDLVESVLGQQADIYSKKTYAVGDYCIYENALYKCNTAISSAEDWTAEHWTKTTIANELKSIIGSVTTLNNSVTRLNSKTSPTYRTNDVKLSSYIAKTSSGLYTEMGNLGMFGGFVQLKAGTYGTDDILFTLPSICRNGIYIIGGNTNKSFFFRINPGTGNVVFNNPETISADVYIFLNGTFKIG